ncbi:MAG: NADH-quinone oxidoreductase subunit N [Coraliomargarita sp.]
MNELLAEFLRGYTATNQWMAILPEILLALLALGLLATEMIMPKGSRAAVGRIAIYGQLVILAFVVGVPCLCAPADGAVLFSAMIEQSELTQIMRGFFLLCSILVSYLGVIYLSKQTLARTEFYHLVILVAAAMMLLVQSNNFVMLFVALETVTVAFYVLVAYGCNSAFSLEAGLKYLILGAMSSAILLFGIVLLYGVAGNPELVGASSDSLNFDALRDFIVLNQDNLLVRVGALLVVAGMLFKIGAVPFQIWVPDVYQGAPTPVTAFLAVASKAAGFIVLVQLISGPFMGLANLMIPVLGFIAAATILFGNMTAVTQRNTKRLMGLSGIAHAGYLLVGVVAYISGVEWAMYAILFYLFTYLLGSFAVFGVMSLASGTDDANQELDHYDSFAKKNPFLGAVLAVGLGSLAGIPPLGGFIAKLFLFIAAFQAGLYGLLGISILGVVISIYYYFGWVREAFFTNFNDSTEIQPKAFGVSDRFVLGALLAGTVLLGIFPGAAQLLP